MIHLSYTRQHPTLCGAEIDPGADVENGKLCDDCIAVAWKEQYRRNHLVKHKAEAPKAEPSKQIVETVQAYSGLYLSHYLEGSE